MTFAQAVGLIWLDHVRLGVGDVEEFRVRPVGSGPSGCPQGRVGGREQFLPDDHGEQRIRRSRTPGAEGRDSSSPSPPFSPVVHNLWTTGERKMLSSARPTGAPVDGVEHHPARVAPLTSP